MSDERKHCEWILDRLDAFVDGELAADERDAVETHCTDCNECARELEVARHIRDELRALGPLEAPRGVVEAAARGAGATDRSNVVPLRSRRAGRSLRIAAAVAAAVTLIGATVWLGLRAHAPREPEMSEADVRRATAEVELAFGYVDHYSDHAAGIVRDDVIGKRVLPRIERALEASRDAAMRDALVPGLKRAVHESGLDVTSPPPDRS
jgi:hypothetical protein